MPPNEKRDQIVSIIRQRGRAHVDELAHMLGISRETIRHDLTELATLDKV